MEQRGLNLFNKLKRLFSTDVIVRKIDDSGRLKVVDVNAIQRTSLTNLNSTYRGLYSTNRKLAYEQNAAYFAQRTMLFKDYECLSGDTLIPLPDGTERTIEELSILYPNRKNSFYVYSYDHTNDCVKLGLAHSVKKTKTEMTYKITFDNGEYLIATANHPFLMRDGNYRRVDQLNPNDSVMPFYKKDFYNNGYKQIYNFSKKWQSEHKIIAEQFYRPLKSDEVVHHKDFVKYNNLPDNLQIMKDSEHRKFHCEIINKNIIWSAENYERQCKAISEGLNRSDFSWNGKRREKNNPFYGKTHSKKSNELRSKSLKRFYSTSTVNLFGNNNFNYRNDISFDLIVDSSIDLYKNTGKLLKKNLLNFLKCDNSVLFNRLNNNGINSWTEYKEFINDSFNHKIISIEEYEVIDVYDMTVDVYHNFATKHCFVHNSMDSDPIISSALDIYADESTVKNENGDVLMIKSENEKVREELENLFYDVMNIEFNIWPMTRGLCKYGDFYYFLEISDTYGIVNIIPLSVYELERIEEYDGNNVARVYFKTVGASSISGEFEKFQIAHFRMMSDTNFLPYGKSILEAARRVWKQLTLMEDAMLIHRITRAPEKRIFKIDVGNVTPDKIKYVMEDIINQVKKVPFIDERTGEYNLRYNLENMLEDFYIPVRGGDSGTDIETLSGLSFDSIESIEYLRNKMMAALKVPKAFLGYEEEIGSKCLHPNTEIVLLSGNSMTIKELEKLYKEQSNVFQENFSMWTYGFDFETKSVIPVRIKEVAKTRQNAELVEVVLSNGKAIKCTPDHNFITYDGHEIQAKDLKEGNVLRSIYRKYESIISNLSNDDNVLKYEKIYQPSEKRWVWAHNVINEYITGERLSPEGLETGDMKVVHHITNDTLNNDPSNLIRVSWNDHLKMISADRAQSLPILPDQNEMEGSVKVISVKYIEERVDTYNLEVDDSNHNFLTNAGIFIKNSTLAAEDVRFARTIERVQKILEQEFTRIAIIHLYSKGFKDKDLLDFELKLTNPSTIYEQEKLELWSSKFSIARDAVDSHLFSSDWVYEQMFNLSSDDIEFERKRVINDVKRKFRLEQISQEGNDPAQSGQAFDTDGNFDPDSGDYNESKYLITDENPKFNIEYEDLNTETRNGGRGLKDRNRKEDEAFGDDPLGQKDYRTSRKPGKTGHDYTGKSPLATSMSIQHKSKIRSLKREIAEEMKKLKKNSSRNSVLTEKKTVKKPISGINGKDFYLDETNIKEI